MTHLPDVPDARTAAWRMLHPGSSTPPRGWGRKRRRRPGPSRPTEAEQAAALLAADRLTDAEIAAQLRISRRTLARWKHLPGVQQAISDLLDSYERHLGPGASSTMVEPQKGDGTRETTVERLQ